MCTRKTVACVTGRRPSNIWRENEDEGGEGQGCVGMLKHAVFEWINSCNLNGCNAQYLSAFEVN
eukprot:5082-Amphidinium_carterae.1